MSGLLFADNFVGLAESNTTLQSLIDITQNYSRHSCFEANIQKCALVVFSRLDDP